MARRNTNVRTIRKMMTAKNAERSGDTTHDATTPTMLFFKRPSPFLDGLSQITAAGPP